MAIENMAIEDCITACQKCHDLCIAKVLANGAERDVGRDEPDHFRDMTNCADICRTAINFLRGGSPFYSIISDACAKICFACADSCVAAGGMEDCVHACRQCGQHCQRLGYTYS